MATATRTVTGPSVDKLPILAEAAAAVETPEPAAELEPVNTEGQPSIRLVIVIPSKGRPESVQRTIAAWESTGAFDVAGIRWALNSSDPRVDEYLEAIIQYGRADRTSAVAYPDMRMVPRLNAATLDVLDELPELEAIGFQGDDHVPMSTGWATEYLDNLAELVEHRGAGMVHGDDMLRGKTLASEWCVSRSWVDTLNRMVPALVQHLYCDDAVQDLAKAAGIYRYLGDERVIGPGTGRPVLIEHRHPLAKGTGAEIDATYRYGGLNGDVKAADHKAYIRWSSRPESVAKTGLARQAAALYALRPAP